MSLAANHPINVAMETSSYGNMIHIIDLPGSFTRDPNIDNAMDKAKSEVRRYCTWAGWNLPDEIQLSAPKYYETLARIDDGDTEALLDEDRAPIDAVRYDEVSLLAEYSAECFEKLFSLIPDPDWIDPSKVRKTFYGDTPCTARQMLKHVNDVQAYYLSRLGLDIAIRPEFLVENRQQCVTLLKSTFLQGYLNKVYSLDNESWTLSKVLRRLIWHDLIHAKALYRLGLKIAPETVRHGDPFFFTLVGNVGHSA